MLRDEDITFVLAGTSNEIDLIKQKIEENNLNNKVEILGWVSDKEKLFKDCFASILPSYNECIPMGILESMSYGVPCIATNVGGIPEIITNQEDGVLINPGNINEIANSILMLKNNSNLKKILSIRCREKYLNYFSEDEHIKRLITIYSK